jgi:hypothetical protein
MDEQFAGKIASWSFILLLCGLAFPFILMIIIVILKLPQQDWYLTAGWISAFLPTLLSVMLNSHTRRLAFNKPVWITALVFLIILIVILIITIALLMLPAGPNTHLGLVTPPLNQSAPMQVH